MHISGRVAVYSAGTRALAYHCVQSAKCRSRVCSNGSNSAVSAKVAADSVLLPKASANTEERGSSPSKRYVAGARRGVFPVHSAVAGEILPAVARAHVTGARAPERIALPVSDCGERERKGSLACPQHPATAVFGDLSIVAQSRAPQMRSEQSVGAKIRVAREHDLDQERIALHTAAPCAA